jgi:hypothetical protein
LSLSCSWTKLLCRSFCFIRYGVSFGSPYSDTVVTCSVQCVSYFVCGNQHQVSICSAFARLIHLGTDLHINVACHSCPCRNFLLPRFVSFLYSHLSLMSNTPVLYNRTSTKETCCLHHQVFIVRICTPGVVMNELRGICVSFGIAALIFCR